MQFLDVLLNREIVSTEDVKPIGYGFTGATCLWAVSHILHPRSDVVDLLGY